LGRVQVRERLRQEHDIRRGTDADHDVPFETTPIRD